MEIASLHFVVSQNQNGSCALHMQPWCSHACVNIALPFVAIPRNTAEYTCYSVASLDYCCYTMVSLSLIRQTN